MSQHIHEEEEYFPRFTFSQRCFHMVLLVTFSLVAITGLPQKYFYTKWGYFLNQVWGGMHTARIVHRIAGVVLVCDFFCHSAYLIIRLNQEKWKSLYRDYIMIPNPNDGHAAIQWFKYILFLSDERPEQDKYAWKEKFDYWAVYWGCVMFGATGPMLWFPHLITKYLPAWAINIGYLIHTDEAILAVMVIYAWHFYNVHFGPEKFPMGTTWYTGYLDKESMVEEHLMYYKTVMDDRFGIVSDEPTPEDVIVEEEEPEIEEDLVEDEEEDFEEEDELEEEDDDEI